MVRSFVFFQLERRYLRILLLSCPSTLYSVSAFVLRACMQSSCHRVLVLQSLLFIVTGGTTPSNFVLTCDRSRILFSNTGLVHGFHHVTDLAFYRSKQNLEFFKTLIGTHQFSREWDDQIAVTIPAAVLAPQKAWKYNATLIHNGRWEGLKNSQRTKHYSYQRMWFEGGIMNSWPAAKALCRPYIKVRG